VSKRSTKVIRLPSSIKLTEPEAIKALAETWQRRRRELANWRPTNGWLLDQQSASSPSTTHRDSGH
jgi:hypothetical protein